MNVVARRRKYRESAQRQKERLAELRRIETLASVMGYIPTFQEYLLYHCYTTVSGNEPLSQCKWLQSIGGNHEQDGMAGRPPGP